MVIMFAKYRNKTVKVLSKYYNGGYLILNNNPIKEEKVFTFTLRDALNIYESIEKYKKECNIISDLEEGNLYMWVDTYYLSFCSLIMETE